MRYLRKNVHVSYLISRWVLVSERSLCYRPSVCRLSVCLSVTSVRPTQPDEIFGNISSPFGTLAIHWPPRKIVRRSSQGKPSVGGLNARGVEKYSDFWHVECYISETVEIGGKLVWITNKKSYMSFRLVPKSINSNDLERRNVPYFSLFHRTRQLPLRIA